jgi:hypothetical protein
MHVLAGVVLRRVTIVNEPHVSFKGFRGWPHITTKKHKRHIVFAAALVAHA